MTEPQGHDPARARDSFLHSRVPPAQPVLSREEIDQYSKDANRQPTPERWKELRTAGGTLLTRLQLLSPPLSDPEQASWKQIAQNLALERTPYDTAKGPAVHLLADPTLRRGVLMGYADHLHRMERLTHPTVLNSRLRLIAQGVPGRLNREIDYFEQAVDPKIRRALSWDDIGWGIPERERAALAEQEDPKDRDESTTAVHAHGMWSNLGMLNGSPRIGLATLGCSHPDLMTALAVAEQAIIGMDAFVPTDGPWGRKDGNGLKAKLEFVKLVMYLIDHHPLILAHKYADKTLDNGVLLSKHLADEAKRRVGVTLKPFPPEDAANQAKQLYQDYHIRLFRIFDPRDSRSSPEAVEAVRKAVGDDCFIYASQVTGIESAEQCRSAGANAVVMNIGDGESCSTASGTGLIASNLLRFYLVQKELHSDMGIVVDGGVGQKTGLALGLGATGAMKHGSVLGGTLHHGPVLIGILDETTGNICFLQSGEAARRTKYRGGGRIKNVEGVDGHRVWVPSMGPLPGFAKLLEEGIFEPLAKELAFCEARNLAQYMQWQAPPFWEATMSAARRAAPHFGQT